MLSDGLFFMGYPMKHRLDKKYMLRAIREAQKNLSTGDGGPFGACIVKGETVLAVARNTVLRQDATCHAEMNAIRKASRRMKSFDLSGSFIYSTTEPCPMCFSAIHWARIEGIAYGTTIADVHTRGFNELPIPDFTLKKIGKSRVKIVAKFLRDECEALLCAWDKIKNKRVY